MPIYTYKTVPDTEMDEMDEGDIRVTDHGPLGGLYLATTAGEIVSSNRLDVESVIADIFRWIARNGVHPSVFHINDHGNVTQWIIMAKETA